MSKNLQQKQYPNTVLKYLRHPVSYRSNVHKFCPTCFPCFDTDMTCALQRSVSVLAVPGYLCGGRVQLEPNLFSLGKFNAQALKIQSNSYVFSLTVNHDSNSRSYN